jgi:hypothetical protein
VIDIELLGLEEILRRWANVPGINSALGRIMALWARTVVATRLRGRGHYPAPPAGSTYIRTGRLGAGWDVRMTGPLEHRIVNPTIYATYVVGERQAWMHRGRWWTARQRIDAALPDLVRQMRQAVANLLRGRGFFR